MTKYSYANLGASLLLGLCIASVACSKYMINSSCESVMYSDTQALKLAEERLREFCITKGIDFADFDSKKVSKHEDEIWVIDFSSKNDGVSGYYFFRVTIDGCGNIEKSWQYYEK